MHWKGLSDKGLICRLCKNKTNKQSLKNSIVRKKHTIQLEHRQQMRHFFKEDL